MKFTFEQKLRAVKQYIEKGFCEVPKGIGSKAETYKRHVLEWASCRVPNYFIKVFANCFMKKSADCTTYMQKVPLARNFFD